MVIGAKRNIRVLVLAVFVAALWSWPVQADMVALTLSGQITEVTNVPAPPFEGVQVGDTWTLTYGFDTDAVDMDPSELAGQYRNNITLMTLQIGTASVAGQPGRSCPNQLSSVIGVELINRYADYHVSMSLPDSLAWVLVNLYDNDGTPFADDSLPQALPGPLETAFPDFRGFYLMQPNSSTAVLLKGEVGTPAPTVRSLSQVRTDIQVNAGQEVFTLDLLVNSALFGEGGFASGMFSCPGCEVMGVEPSPFRWIAESMDGVPLPDGAAAISFILNPAGEVMGPDSSPSRILLVADAEILGEVDFSGVTGSYPGILGDFDMEGVKLRLADQSIADIESFEFFDDFEPVLATGTSADFEVIYEPDQTYVALLVNSALYGPGGVAQGDFSCIGCEVMGVEPSPFRWVVDPQTAQVPDGEAAIRFNLNQGGEVMGPDTSPTRILAVAGTEILGVLDFSQVYGHLGSLHLGGVRIELADGSFVPVDDLVALESFVDIDIKPGSEPNSINLKSAGVIPVAMLSSLVFDATTVDPNSVRLAGAAVKLAGKSGNLLAHIEDVNGDGLDDLVCQVLTEQLLIEPGASTAVLQAQTFTGASVEGEDTIVIVSN